MLGMGKLLLLSLEKKVERFASEGHRLWFYDEHLVAHFAAIWHSNKMFIVESLLLLLANRLNRLSHEFDLYPRNLVDDDW